jgi:hypothetical protein
MEVGQVMKETMEARKNTEKATESRRQGETVKDREDLEVTRRLTRGWKGFAGG